MSCPANGKHQQHRNSITTDTNAGKSINMTIQTIACSDSDILARLEHRILTLSRLKCYTIFERN